MNFGPLRKTLALAVLACVAGTADTADLPGLWVPSAPAPAEKLCAVTVLYAPGRPTAVQIHFPGGLCDQEDVALAHALAAILAAQGPATPL